MWVGRNFSYISLLLLRSERSEQAATKTGFKKNI